MQKLIKYCTALCILIMGMQFASAAQPAIRSFTLIARQAKLEKVFNKTYLYVTDLNPTATYLDSKGHSGATVTNHMMERLTQGIYPKGITTKIKTERSTFTVNLNNPKEVSNDTWAFEASKIPTNLKATQLSKVNLSALRIFQSCNSGCSNNCPIMENC